MVRTSKAANAREPHCWRKTAATDAESGDSVQSAHATTTVRLAGSPPALSVRAENVLKELATELTGDCPPKGRWVPPDGLLRKLSFRHLQTARNCGPQTIAEIVGWAGLRGVVIRPPSRAGKSLSVTWHDLVARFSSGDFTRAEIAEALERSTRRKNTRIPVAFQSILLELLNSSG